MPTSQEQIDRLTSEYPFLDNLIRQERVGSTLFGVPFFSTVTVQRGDESLMFWRTGEVVDSCTYGHDKHPDWMGERFRYYHPVSASGTLGEIQSKESVASRFLYEIFDGEQDKVLPYEAFLTGGALFDLIQGFVVVDRYRWYPAGSDLSGTFRKVDPLQYDVDITFYKTPADGWKQLYEARDPARHIELTGWEIMPGPLLGDPTKDALYELLKVAAQKFYHEVWLAGLGPQVQSLETSSGAGRFGDISIRTAVTGGRRLITLERQDSTFTLIGTDGPGLGPVFNMQSVYATAHNARTMVDDAVQFWTAAGEDARLAACVSSTSVGL